MKVYIDGENFRHSVSKILKDEHVIKNTHEMTGFPLRSLLEDILESNDLQITYYASKIKLPMGYQPSPEILSRANQIKEFTRQWVPQLQSQSINYIKAGYLKVKSGQKCPNCLHVHEVLQEKGVDVRVAVDILEDAHLKPKQAIVLFSSDTDLVPALNRVKVAGTKIIYIAYSEAINRAVSATAHETITYTTRKILQHYEGSNGKA